MSVLVPTTNLSSCQLKRVISSIVQQDCSEEYRDDISPEKLEIRCQRRYAPKDNRSQQRTPNAKEDLPTEWTANNQENCCFLNRVTPDIAARSVMQKGKILLSI